MRASVQHLLAVPRGWGAHVVHPGLIAPEPRARLAHVPEGEGNVERDQPEQGADKQKHYSTPFAGSVAGDSACVIPARGGIGGYVHGEWLPLPTCYTSASVRLDLAPIGISGDGG
jgi:hypothetical protein